MIEPYEVPYPFVVRKSGKVMSTRRLMKRGPIGAQIAADGFTVIPSQESDGTKFINFYLNHQHRQYVHRLVAEKYLPLIQDFLWLDIVHQKVPEESRKEL